MKAEKTSIAEKFMDYDQFLNESLNVESTKKWLKKVVKGKYTINPDGTVDVEGDVICKSSEFDKFPVKFGKVTGKFDCSNNKNLKTLEGAPQRVQVFNCNRCIGLKTLEGAPREVENFYCIECTSLVSLEGAPQKVRVFLLQRMYKSGIR
jgi:hypothetical protein